MFLCITKSFLAITVSESHVFTYPVRRSFSLCERKVFSDVRQYGLICHVRKYRGFDDGGSRPKSVSMTLVEIV